MILVQLLRDSIEEYIDMDKYNAVKALEQVEKKKLRELAEQYFNEDNREDSE